MEDVEAKFSVRSLMKRTKREAAAAMNKAEKTLPFEPLNPNADSSLPGHSQRRV
jgi:hypothetical protein